MSDAPVTITNWNAVHGETFGEAIDLVTGFYPVTPSEAEEAIEAALAAGDLVEDDSGAFPVLHVPGFDDKKTSDDDLSTVPRDEALQCIDEILEYYHGEIDEEIEHEKSEYDTPREYYTARGWTDETIDEKRLGYAPANNQSELKRQLITAGFDRDVMLATGLFCESDDGSLYALWRGRFVLPYPDEDGQLVFAISRSDVPPHPRDWAGRYGEEADPAKYHKIPTTRGEVVVNEPIYGLDTVEPGEPVLITEGIADAITAHQHGYACISPVTTQFSNSDMNRLADVLTEHDVDRAYVVQDAERPTSSVIETSDGDEKLHVKQFGPGVKGAVKTASRLVADGVDARVGDLPRPGLDKVDLDDYLTRWNGDLTAVIRSARPPAQHPASEPVKPSREQAGEQEQNSMPPGIDSTGETSALWDLDITDVTGMSVGDRGKNPLGHYGDSEDYFRIYDGKNGKVAYDFKAKTAYNAITYLLCEAGARNAERPGGSVTDEEVWKAWRHAKKSGYISDDDKCPSAALRHVAVSHGVCDADDIVDGWRLPRDAYEATLDVIEEEYGLEHGHTVGGVRVSTVPLARIQHLSWDEARRFAKKRGINWPSTRQARQRLEDAVVNTIARRDHKVIDAPTALGKSHTVAAFPWLRHRDVTGGAPVVHVHATREARDEALATSHANGVNAKAVLGRKEACPVAAGEFDSEITMNGEPASEWMDRQCDGKGIPLSVAHSILDRDNDQDEELPCCRGEQECPSKTQWSDVPWYNPGGDADPGGCGGVEGFQGEDSVKYDVVHATHPMLFVPSMTRDTNVVIDEFPDYALRVEDGSREGGISMDRLQNAVTAYLQAIDAPVTTWEAFITLARSRGDDEFGDLYGSLADQYFELQDAVEERSPPLEWYVENSDAHVLARAVIECILDAFWNDADRNGLRHGTTLHTLPRMDNDNAQVRVSLVINNDNRVKTIRQTPVLTGARSVVGLDAHPAMPLWQLNSVEHIERADILDTVERRFWRLFERGLFTVQVGDATRPLSGPNAKDWFGEEKLNVLLGELVDEGLSTGITTTQVEDELASLLGENGVAEPETMHYGEVRSRNDFGDEDVGFVNGCMDPGDEFVLTVLAEYGCDAEPETTIGEDGDEHRAHGRGFTGPDADTADAILASVRENEVAQAAGRYARNADDPDHRAVVYVRTDATPTGFADVQVGGVEWVATQKQAEIIQSLKSDEWMTAKEIADKIDSTKRHVLKTLKTLREREVLDCRKGAGAYGADLYRAITGVTDTHLTEVGPSITQDCEMKGSMWALVISDVDTVMETTYGESPEPDTLTPTLSGRFAPHPPETSSEGVELDGKWKTEGGEA